MPAPVTVRNGGRELDETSDAVDNGMFSSYSPQFRLAAVPVNVLKGTLWDEQSEFDQQKDKTQFRDYEGACDRVKNFYKEQHGE
jgi:inositol oxygenase